jgi:hypothetical protein
LYNESRRNIIMTSLGKIIVLLLTLPILVVSFGVFPMTAVTPSTQQQQRPTTTTTTAISMAKEDEDLLRFARQTRSAQSDDNVVELMRPLGLVLNQDDNGNVYVETVAARGNAARTGKVRKPQLKMYGMKLFQI